MTTSSASAKAARSGIDGLVHAFFQAVSFEEGDMPPYDDIRRLFIPNGLLIRNTGAAPEISTVDGFIAPRLELVRSGQLTRFLEVELFETTQVFGQVAQRFSGYAKSGSQNGQAFGARGMISTQFIATPDGWRMSSMAWDDERPGIALLPQPGA